jgi:hypothetical protein
VRRPIRLSEMNRPEVAKLPMSIISPRQLVTLWSVALLSSGLGGCGTINEKLAAGLGDFVPQWAGGLPADAPPRPGTALYDEFLRERERMRLEPALPKNEGANVQSLSAEAVH